jgi:hypothetical protein
LAGDFGGGRRENLSKAISWLTFLQVERLFQAAVAA